ncbi:MAG: Gfo/Idh/MocA family oxidoreductase [Clostridia bacterium]|nr:Gfo/Idh/MocA family oxidoreductase [Clostridia bacterium]
MEKLKIGIIGIGGIAKGSHIPAYIMQKNAEIVAVCDIIEERARRAKEKCFKNAKVYTDYKELLKDPDIQAVDICTPNYLHSIIAVDAMEAGKHVLCEKPDAVNPQEAAKMKEASERTGKKLMVIRNNRFIVSSQEAKKIAEDGGFGEIYAARCGWIRRRGIPGKGGWFTTKELSGGGPLIDLGVHMIDLAVWLMGNPRPVAVSGGTFCKFADSDSSDSKNSAFGDKVENGTFDVEDLAMGFIRFENGACLQIEFSWASNIKREKRFVELRGTKAGLQWENGAATIFYEENGKQKNKKLKKTLGVEGHSNNIANFIDYVLFDKEPVYKPQQGLDMIKILSAIYESAQTGREVVLD